MQATDFRSEPELECMSEGHIFDRVLVAKQKTTIIHLAKMYVNYTPLQSDLAIVRTLTGLFDEVTEESTRQNWAFFCIRVILKKNCLPTPQWNECVTRLVKKFDSVPGFEVESVALNSIRKNKMIKPSLNEFIHYTLNDSIENGILTHGWFFERKIFLKELGKLGKTSFVEAQKVANALVMLAQYDPPVLGCPIFKEQALLMALLTKNHELEDLVKAPVQSSRRISSGEMYLPQYFFQDILTNYIKGEDTKEIFNVLAKDLNVVSGYFFMGCYLSDLTKPSFDMKGSEGLVGYTGYFNGIDKFIKELIVNGKKDRPQIISFFIQLACSSFKASDHLSTMAIVLALESTEVSQCKEAWEKVNVRLKMKQHHIMSLFAPFSNYRKLREFLESYDKMRQPLVPFLAPFLADLIIADENPNKVEGQINYYKIDLLASILKRLFKIKQNLKLECDIKTDIVYLIRENK